MAEVLFIVWLINTVLTIPNHFNGLMTTREGSYSRHNRFVQYNYSRRRNIGSFKFASSSKKLPMIGWPSGQDISRNFWLKLQFLKVSRSLIENFSTIFTKSIVIDHNLRLVGGIFLHLTLFPALGCLYKTDF